MSGNAAPRTRQVVCKTRKRVKNLFKTLSVDCNGDRLIGSQALFSNTQFLGIYIGCLYEVLIGVADTAFATLRDRR
jgi:hypothetical protein